MKVEIDVPLAGLPADRKLSHVVAKHPEIGDWYLDSAGEWEQVAIDFHTTRIVARFEPIETWRPVTIEDAVDALRGDSIRVRAKDNDDKNWACGTLAGCSGIVINRKPLFPWAIRTSDNGICTYSMCEVQEFK